MAAGHSADDDRIAARQAEAIKLRVRGKSVREIAEALGISKSQAAVDVRAAMAATAKEAEENVNEQRGLELGRLERALEVVESVLTKSNGAEEGDELALKALDRLVKIQDQRAKILGLYAPEKREIAASVATASPEAAARLVRETFGAHALPKEDDAARNAEAGGDTPISPGASSE